jgi:hypothetical protein
VLVANARNVETEDDIETSQYVGVVLEATNTLFDALNVVKALNDVSDTHRP